MTEPRKPCNVSKCPDASDPLFTYGELSEYSKDKDIGKLFRTSLARRACTFFISAIAAIIIISIIMTLVWQSSP